MAFLVEKLKNSDNLIKAVKSSTIVDELVTITQIFDLANDVNSVCGNLIESCQIYFAERAKMNEVAEIDRNENSADIIPHDPGLRKEVLSDQEKKYLINLGPHQPKLKVFPNDGKNSFCPEWYREFEFLEYSTSKDAAFCFVCYLFPVGSGRSKSESAWRTEGVRNWRKMKSSGREKSGKLQLHFNSGAHKAALFDYCHFLVTAGHIDILLDKEKRNLIIEEEKTLVFNRNVVKMLFDVTQTLAKQGIAFRGNVEEDSNFTQIVKLLSRHNLTLKQWLDDSILRPYHVTYLSAESQNEFIHLLGLDVKKKVIREIQESPFFTIMADHTPDVANNEVLSVVVRTVNDSGCPRERLLGVTIVNDKTGEGTANEILKMLSDNDIDTSKLSFQSYDFAASMSGCFNGTQKKMSEKVGHNVIFIPCQAHRTNTAVEHSCRASTIISDTFDILEELYVFFSSSTKKFHRLKTKLEGIENSILLKNLSKTRWTARAETLKAVNISFEAILEVLDDIITDQTIDNKGKAKALGLYKRLLSFDFICSLFFTKNIFYKLKIVTEILEKDYLNIIDALQVISSTTNSLTNIRMDETHINDLIESAIIFSTKLGFSPQEDFEKHHRRRLKPKKIDNNADNAADLDLKTFYRKEFSAVLDTLIEFLKNNLSSVVENLSGIDNIFKFPLSEKNLDISSVQKIVALFPPNLRPDEHALQTQLQVLFNICKDNSVNTMQGVMDTAVQYQTPLRQAFMLCQLIFTAGYSTATNERKFSLLKFLKNTNRSNMTSERLDSLMIIKSEKDLVNADLTEAINQWTELKQRRIKLKK